MKSTTFWSVSGWIIFTMAVIWLMVFMSKKHESQKQFETPHTYQTVSD